MGDIVKFMYSTLDVSVVRFFLWGIVAVTWGIVAVTWALLILVIKRIVK